MSLQINLEFNGAICYALIVFKSFSCVKYLSFDFGGLH